MEKYSILFYGFVKGQFAEGQGAQRRSVYFLLGAVRKKKSYLVTSQRFPRNLLAKLLKRAFGAKVKLKG